MILQTFERLKLNQSFVSFAVKYFTEAVRNGCLFFVLKLPPSENLSSPSLKNSGLKSG